MQKKAGWIAKLIVAIIIGGWLIWFGIRLLTKQPNLTTNQLFLTGLAAGFAGVFVLSSKGNGKGKIFAGGGCILVSMYYFLRAFGAINIAMLNTVLGIASIIAAFLLVYVLLASKKASGAPTKTAPTDEPENLPA